MAHVMQTHFHDYLSIVHCKLALFLWNLHIA